MEPTLTMLPPPPADGGDLLRTALREACEEVGLDPDGVERIYRAIIDLCVEAEGKP